MTITSTGFVNSDFSAPNIDCNQITIVNMPSGGTDGTNKDYVDNLASGFTFKTACYCSTIANLTATYANGAAGVGATLTNSTTQAAFSTDGVSPPINSRVLVKDQTTTSRNGIYTLTTVGTGATNWVLTRATDYDSAAEIQPGDLVPVNFGTQNQSTFWSQIATVVTVGTDPVIFIIFGSRAIVVDQYAAIIGGPNNTLVSVDADPIAGIALVSTGATSNPDFTTVVVQGGGTGSVSFNAYGPVVAASTTTGALTSVVPSATSGVPLISQGSATKPAFGTAVVAGGGTGVAALTAFTPLCGGTTTTNPVQSVASIGTTGQVLTSNGAGFLPTFQSPTATGNILVLARLNNVVYNATGDGTTAHIIYDTATVNTGGAYNVVTGLFTSPITAKYYISGCVSLYGITSAMTSGYVVIVTSPINSYPDGCNYGAVNAGSTYNASFFGFAELTAGQTIGIYVNVNFGTRVVQLQGYNVTNAYNYMSIIQVG